VVVTRLLSAGDAGRISITRGGFQPFAIAPAYLRIAGRWQDHILFNPAG
jgi:[ribosomal protein S5]-alanine N-acetyltransferase